jgi:tetratricopeptide (TPR) repeat protein
MMRWVWIGVLAPSLLAGCPKKGAPTGTGEPSPTVASEGQAEGTASAQTSAPSAADRRQVTDAVAKLTIGTPEAARQARDQLMKAAQRDPQNALIHFNLGVAHEQLGALSDAERSFRQAVGLDPKLARAYLGLGLLLEKQGQSRRAVQEYRNGVSANEEDMDLRAALIGALRRSGETQQAIAEAKTALAFNNKSLPVFNELGLVYLDTGQLPLAQFVYQKALSAVDGARTSALIRSNYGWTFYRDAQPIKARVQLEEAHRLDPKYLPALVYLSHLYIDDRNYEGALPLLEEAKRQEPDNYDILLNLGIAYRGVGRHQEAKQAYERALEVGGRPEPLMNLGILYGDYLKDYPKALEAFRNYISRGGAQKELAQSYIQGVEREQLRVQRQRERDEERKKREQERLERERLLQEAGGSPPADGGPWGPQ